MTDELRVTCKRHTWSPWRSTASCYWPEDRALGFSDPRADFYVRECEDCGYRDTTTAGLLTDCEPLKPPGLDC